MPSRLLFIVLALILVVASARSSFAQDTIIELTNAVIKQSVPGAVATGLLLTSTSPTGRSPSRCRFDTFPTVLSELKYRGVADSVLMAMVQVPVGAPPSKQSVPGAVATGSQLTNGNGAEQTQITPRTEPSRSTTSVA